MIISPAYVKVLATGSWSQLEKATTKEVAGKVASLLGIKFHSVIEDVLYKNVVLVVRNNYRT